MTIFVGNDDEAHNPFPRRQMMVNQQAHDNAMLASAVRPKP